MARICEDNDRKAAQERDYAFGLDHSDIASVLLGVPFNEMSDN